MSKESEIKKQAWSDQTRQTVAIMCGIVSVVLLCAVTVIGGCAVNGYFKMKSVEKMKNPKLHQSRYSAIGEDSWDVVEGEE